MDVELIETSKLIDELIRRHNSIIFATMKIEEGGEPLIYTYWSEDKYLECSGLCNLLDRDIKDFYTLRRMDAELDDEELDM